MCLCVFFQAEDGIRDLVRSRGLGDVYKRQIQSLALSCYDEALALPTEEAQATALRTQQIIAHEIGATEVIDPLAGSYYVESLTDRLEAEARALIEKIEEMGGSIQAIESGWMQQEIADSAWKYQQAVESGRQLIVGVNAFQAPGEERPVGIFRPDPELSLIHISEPTRPY